MATAWSDTIALHIQPTTLALLSKCEMKKHIRCESELSEPSSIKRLMTFFFLPEANRLHSSSCWAATSLNPTEELLSSTLCLQWRWNSGVKYRLVEHKSWNLSGRTPSVRYPAAAWQLSDILGKDFAYIPSCSPAGKPSKGCLKGLYFSCQFAAEHSQTGASKHNLEQ